MATEFKVILNDTPGSLARLGGVLGDAGVNIEAILGHSRDGKGFVHFIPRDAAMAAHALEAAGIAYTQRDVLIVRVLDEPGTLGDVALVMSKANINIDSVYLTTRGAARPHRHQLGRRSPRCGGKVAVKVLQVLGMRGRGSGIAHADYTPQGKGGPARAGEDA